MATRTEYAEGEFCWIDLASPDVEASKRFYADLFGWDSAPVEPVEETGGYVEFTVGGKRVAGMGPLQDPQQPPVWSSYVSTGDVAATAEAVGAAGGVVVIPPLEIPGGAGTMAVFQDPEGAFISAWEPGSYPGAQLVNEVPAWTWNELNSRDPERAKRFYGEVFGWTTAAPPVVPEGIDYTMWHVADQRWNEGIAGMLTMDAAWPDEVPAHWLVYFTVEDAAASCEKAKGAGGKVMVQPQEIAVGTMAVLSDDHGASFAILQPNDANVGGR